MCLAKNRITKYRVDKRRMERQKQIGEQKTLWDCFCFLFMLRLMDTWMNIDLKEITELRIGKYLLLLTKQQVNNEVGLLRDGFGVEAFFFHQKYDTFLLSIWQALGAHSINIWHVAESYARRYHFPCCLLLILFTPSWNASSYFLPSRS